MPFVPKKSGRFRVRTPSDEWLAMTLAAVEVMASRHKLSRIERDILAATMRGKDRRSIMESRQVSPNTLKTQVRRLLFKTGYSTLNDLRDAVLRLLSGPERTRQIDQRRR
jgi:DNA-binding CsgD family transcriptional regulator